VAFIDNVIIDVAETTAGITVRGHRVNVIANAGMADVIIKRKINQHLGH